MHILGKFELFRQTFPPTPLYYDPPQSTRKLTQIRGLQFVVWVICVAIVKFLRLNLCDKETQLFILTCKRPMG